MSIVSPIVKPVVEPVVREVVGAGTPFIPPPLAQFSAKLVDTLVSESAHVHFYSRTSVATVIDYLGNMVECLNGEARFLGSQRVRNLFLQSQNFTNSYWTSSSQRITVTGNTQIAPDGSMTAETLDDGTLTGLHRLFRSLSLKTNTDYAVSFFLKAGTGQWFRLQMFDGSFRYGNFDLVNGVVGHVEQAFASIEDVGNGWYRCSIFGNSPNVVSQIQLIIMDRDSAVNDTASTGDNRTVHIWGGQLEEGTLSYNGYVSTNVLATPFHGANVDGVKYFESASSKGILLEEASTNYFLNSRAPVTQATMTNGGTVPSTVTVTGTTEITVDGNVVTSASPFTYTPAGATSDIQVTTVGDGTVQFEALNYPTSHIITGGASVARGVDILNYTYSPANLIGSMAVQVKELPDVSAPADTHLVSSNITARFVYNGGTPDYHNYEGVNTGSYGVTGVDINFGMTWDTGNVTTTYADGALAGTVAIGVNGFDPQADLLGVGSLGSTGASQQSGAYSNLTFYDTELTQEVMERLT